MARAEATSVRSLLRGGGAAAGAAAGAGEPLDSRSFSAGAGGVAGVETGAGGGAACAISSSPQIQKHDTMHASDGCPPSKWQNSEAQRRAQLAPLIGAITSARGGFAFAPAPSQNSKTPHTTISPALALRMGYLTALHRSR